MKRVINSKTGRQMPDPGLRIDSSGRYRLKNGWIILVDIIKQKFVVGCLPELRGHSKRLGFDGFVDWQWARVGGKSLSGGKDGEYDIVAKAPDRAVITKL